MENEKAKHNININMKKLLSRNKNDNTPNSDESNSDDFSEEKSFFYHEKEIKNYKKYQDLKRLVLSLKEDKDKQDKASSLRVKIKTFLTFILLSVFYYYTDPTMLLLERLPFIICITVFAFFIYRIFDKRPLPNIPEEFSYLKNERFFNIASYYHYMYDNPKEINNKFLNKVSNNWYWGDCDLFEMIKLIQNKNEDDFIDFLKENNKDLKVNYD